ncbi:MAG: carboxypeptidase-like regulatory domain-containing protein [Chitinophagaceae bacterium]
MMKIFLQITVSFLLFFISNKSFAQSNQTKDSVIQLYGVIMTADSLRAVPGASIVVVNKGRGTISNVHGVFSIAVLKGDKISFSSVGFKDKEIIIPKNLKENQYSVIQLMVEDTSYLPATIIKAKPSREQFERDFATTRMDDDAYEIARQNTEENKMRALMATLPADGKEAVNFQFRQQAIKYYYAGQIPPQNIFNPAAWGEFIKAWKRGDFKRKKN